MIIICTFVLIIICSSDIKISEFEICITTFNFYLFLFTVYLLPTTFYNIYVIRDWNCWNFAISDFFPFQFGRFMAITSKQHFAVDDVFLLDVITYIISKIKYVLRFE